jgi:hypothetical protein
MSILVAGIGSSYGADFLGWEVADFLARGIASRHPQLGQIPAVLQLEDDLHIKKFLHPTAAIASVGGYRSVLFVDAMRSSEHRYGELLQLHANDLQPTSGALSSHSSGLDDAINLSRTLGVLPDDCWVFGLNALPLEDQPFASDLQKKLVAALWQAVVNRCSALPFCRRSLSA